MTVATVMTQNPACCTPNSSLTEVARQMVDNDCGEIPVVEDMISRRLAGVITDRDIATRIVAKGKNSGRCEGKRLHDHALRRGQPGYELEDCCEVMETNKIRRVPVVDDKGGVVGIISLADVVRNAAAATTASVVKEVSTDV